MNGITNAEDSVQRRSRIAANQKKRAKNNNNKTKKMSFLSPFLSFFLSEQNVSPS